ncbi:hypothetical protein [Kitasatospora aureofaciens]|uniref:hypothetical protein n=1 Tax=Kitasatospora aureofaciens TaxID=1894 RepID=UPI0037CB83E2
MNTRPGRPGAGATERLWDQDDLVMVWTTQTPHRAPDASWVTTQPVGIVDGSQTCMLVWSVP